METIKHYYVCDGPVRGACGHKHSTESGAIRCLSQDRQGCSSQGGYSDREIYRVTGNDREVMYEIDNNVWVTESEYLGD